MLIVNIQKELGMMCGVDIIRKGMSHICLKLIVLILVGGMMRYELNFDEDKVNDVLVVGGASYDLKGCCDIMNEQQATIELLTKRRDKWRELSNSFSAYCNCYEKAIERAFEEKPYPSEEDIYRIYAELEKELENE